MRKSRLPGSNSRPNVSEGYEVPLSYRGDRLHDVDFFIIQKVHDTVIHLEVDEEQWEITQGSKKQAERTGFLAQYLSGLRHTDAPHT